MYLDRRCFAAAFTISPGPVENVFPLFVPSLASQISAVVMPPDAVVFFALTILLLQPLL
jgi:hypothetical protein